MFDKTKKNLAGGTPLTTLDLAAQRLEKLLQEKDQANALCHAKVEAMAKERAGLVKQVEDLASKLQKLNEDYLKAQQAMKTEAQKRIAEASVTEADLAAGRVNIREFLAAGKKDEIIAAEAVEAADQELGKIRDIIRGVKAQQFQIILQVREKEEAIAREKSWLGENFYQALKSMQAHMEMAGVNIPPNVEFAHGRTKEAQNDVALVKGGPLWSVLTLRVASMEEAELLFNDPRISPAHFGELRNFIQEIQSLEFSEITFHYTPAERQGRGAGSIWFDYRPAVVVTP